MSDQIKNAAVVSQRVRVRKPHPLQSLFDDAGLDRDMIDDFPTQPWAVRAWCEYIAGWKPLDDPARMSGRSVWEPAANRGFLVRGLQDYCDVIASDIFDYGAGFKVFNFLDCHPNQMALLGNGAPFWLVKRPHWIITNPPFARAQEFIEAALAFASVGIAMLCRIQILETLERYNTLYNPRNRVHWAFSQFVERVPMHEFTMRRDMTTMSAYGWLTIWKEPMVPTFILDRRHIPPCRLRLEKSDDYRWPVSCPG